MDTCIIAARDCAFKVGMNVGSLEVKWLFPKGIDDELREFLSDPIERFGWLPEPDLTGHAGPDLTPHSLTLGCWPEDGREPLPEDEAAVTEAFCSGHRQAVLTACGLDN